MRISKPIERWFPAPKDPDKSEHLVRHLMPGEIQDIAEEFSNQQTRYIMGNDNTTLTPEITSSQKPVKMITKIRVASISGWKIMFDENGNEMKCTEENKIRALREIEGYAEFIDECREKLAQDIKKEREKNLGNL